MYADVLILGTPGNFEQILTYNIPAELELLPGSLVLVPIRQRISQGLILSVHKHRPELRNLKNIRQVLTAGSVVSECRLKLASWMAEYYVCSLNKVIQLFLPPPVRTKEQKIYLLNSSFSAAELLLPEIERKTIEALREKLPVGMTKQDLERKLQQPVQKELENLLDSNLIREEIVFVPQVTKKEENIFKLKAGHIGAEELLRRAPQQRKIYELLKEGPLSVNDLKVKGVYSRSAVQGLYEKQLIEIFRKDVIRNPLQAKLSGFRPQVLNEEQDHVWTTICAHLGSKKRKWLLYGITGSGKTEVYIRVMEKVIKQGQQVLYLVPEISLTPQLTSLLVEVFGDKVAVLHSALSEGERYDQWRKIREGRASVVLGPRSAVFAPFSALGLIIIDEEHENTYKQNEPDPRYDAHRVAEKLVELTGATLIMGSATPSLRSFFLAKKGDFALLKLPRRVTARPLPLIEIIDQKKEISEGNRSIFSAKLVEYLQNTIKSGEQAILFMNRRGFHTYVMCRECGKPLTCPHCSITLIYHQSENKLVCHYCQYQRSVPKNCAYCGSSFVRYYGTGTERVATEFAKLFPGISFIRMDTDTTQRKNSHMRLIKEFQEGKAQILIGTQMVAKGLDFPRVTLVGVINSDLLLNMPDYQAGERAYQLLTQVAGRAGRGKKTGRVVIQTFDPEHYLFSAVVRQNYEEFYQQEIANRQVLQYPPYTNLARIMVSGYQERQVVQRIGFWLQLLQSKIKTLNANVELLGPTPAPLGFLKKRYRYHIIIKGKELMELQELAREIRAKELKNSGEPRTIIDIEPQNLL